MMAFSCSGGQRSKKGGIWKIREALRGRKKKEIKEEGRSGGLATMAIRLVVHNGERLKG